MVGGIDSHNHGMMFEVWNPDYVFESKGGKSMSSAEWKYISDAPRWVLSSFMLVCFYTGNLMVTALINAAQGMDYVQWIIESFIVYKIIDWVLILFNNKLLLIHYVDCCNYFLFNSHAYPLTYVMFTH